MAGLSAVLLGLALLAAGQEPPTLAAARQTRDLRVLETLLASPAPRDPAWQRRLFPVLVRLEGSSSSRVHEAWRLLASTGADRDRGNLVLYERRHGMEPEPPPAEAGPAWTLEWALHLWGSGRLEACRRVLAAAARRFPEDPNFLENLLWLEGRAPDPLPLDARPRLHALAVLTARGEGG